MKTNLLPTFLQKKKYEIVKGLTLDIDVSNNPYNIPIENLFSMAMRINKKRRFLFVSNVLGKHLAVDPFIPMLTGAALALRFIKKIYNIESLVEKDVIEALKTGKNLKETYAKVMSSKIIPPENLIFIGFAETATALGHSMFEFFSDNSIYIHTTREKIQNINPSISFEEEHSHATSHRLYDCYNALDSSQGPVIIVDDEISTGKTLYNIISSMDKYSKRKKYIIASILDWRSKDSKKLFYHLEKKLGIDITFISLLSGEFTVNEDLNTLDAFINKINSNNSSIINKVDFKNEPEIISLSLKDFKLDTLNYSSTHSYEKNNASCYLKSTGRFGIDSSLWNDEQKTIKKIGEYLKSIRKGKRVLCLGTEEFMHIPMKIASYMGDGVKFHSTTRSPIYPLNKENYAINSGIEFKSPNEVDILNFVYNIPSNYYDELYIFFERNVDDKTLAPLLSKLKLTKTPRIYILKLT
ncbi:MAG: hypothetical protein GX387_07225 [Clostridium sp.]|jgi:hypoxanthine phosphoribosyltransferase|nr:hypothetical protein [Clostridium sp.]